VQRRNWRREGIRRCHAIQRRRSHDPLACAAQGIHHTHHRHHTHLMPSYKAMPRRDDHLARAYGQPTALVHVHLMVQSALSAEKHETAERLFRKRQLVDLDGRDHSERQDRQSTSLRGVQQPLGRREKGVKAPPPTQALKQKPTACRSMCPVTREDRIRAGEKRRCALVRYG
jgi:hypothetical protein